MGARVSREGVGGSSPLARGGPARSGGGVLVGRLIPAGAGRTTLQLGAGPVAGAHPRWRGADHAPTRGRAGCGGSSPLARGGRPWGLLLPLRRGLIPAGAGRTVGRLTAAPELRAHPRWRGADVRRQFSRRWMMGSSPLARGGHEGFCCWASRPGLIPAGAGRTRSAHRPPGRRPAHPRWRGADRGAKFRSLTMPGSSPLARGGLLDATAPMQTVGLIPAGAGRTSTASRIASALRAHPRWRGADFEEPNPYTSFEGSSPLARGGLGGRGLQSSPAGLIPAGAGRTTRESRTGCPSGAHPRWRGADLTRASFGTSQPGSSPLARGGQVIVRADQPGRGLIPAGAGRTRSRTVPQMTVRAHPRWRGADVSGGSVRVDRQGSSPLARGGLTPPPGHPLAAGLIPAGAGQTWPHLRGRGRTAAHPRWRGADAQPLRESVGRRGSSPLARGGLRGAQPLHQLRGLIPAGAGRTPRTDHPG